MDQVHIHDRSTSTWRRLPMLVLFCWLFFLALDLLGSGMKQAFAASLQAWLAGSGQGLTELSAFVAGIVGTALVQSSSSVTSMTVVLAQEGLLPLVLAIGIAHGANLGTCVTSTLVALVSETRPAGGGGLITWLRHLFFSPRLPGFKRAVSAAVMHDVFNIVMVTSILLLIELPFGVVAWLAESSATHVAGFLGAAAGLPEVLHAFSPATYTKPVTGALTEFGVPGLVLVALGLPLLFVALKGFAKRMKAVVLDGVDESNFGAVGARFLGSTGREAFVRGLLVTILVQSSSVTTSLVVPLAAMGLFTSARVFPFILGANIGTTTTALLAATAGIGGDRFLPGMTIALSHVYLNLLAVLLVVTVPGLSRTIMGSAEALAATSERTPATLLIYLFALVVALPVVVFMLPTAFGVAVLGALLVWIVTLGARGPSNTRPTPDDFSPGIRPSAGTA